MEFLPYAETVRTLEQQGVVARPSGDLVRFVLRPAPGRTAATPHRVAFGPRTVTSTIEGIHNHVEVPAEKLGETLEHLIARSHLGEFVVIPAAAWRPVLDLAAFDLASDESWLEVDAEASLHQNKRDPLGLLPRSRHVLRIMVNAIIANAPGAAGGCDLTVAAIDAPLFVEVRAGGALVLWCAGEGIAHGLLSKL